MFNRRQTMEEEKQELGEHQLGMLKRNSHEMMTSMPKKYFFFFKHSEVKKEDTQVKYGIVSGDEEVATKCISAIVTQCKFLSSLHLAMPSSH